MSRFLLGILVVLGAFVAAPALAGPASPILGMMPMYPGASRPVPHWESPSLAIAMTLDKPEAVIVYYLNRMPTVGWTPEDGIAKEARDDARAGQPAWLTFTRPGLGRLDIEITHGRHPKTGNPVTLIFYQSSPPKP